MLADAPAPAVVHVAEKPPAWTLVSVRPSGRALVVGAVMGGCRDLQVTVSAQDDASVTLAAAHAPSEEQSACPATLTFQEVLVRLGRPLAGRALPGQARVHGLHTQLGAPLPRLTGARARDALLSLRNQGYRPHLAGPIDGVVRRVRLSVRRERDDEVTVVAAPRR